MFVFMHPHSRQHTHTHTHGPPRRAFSCPAPVVYARNMWSLTAHMWSLTAHIAWLWLWLWLWLRLLNPLEFLELNDRTDRFAGQLSAPLCVGCARQRFAPVDSNSILSFIKRINQRSNRLPHPTAQYTRCLYQPHRTRSTVHNQDTPASFQDTPLNPSPSTLYPYFHPLSLQPVSHSWNRSPSSSPYLLAFPPSNRLARY
jgi:hypothetical protein